jgi:diacylglycerol kinase
MRSRNLPKSFRFAFSGLWVALRTQRHTCIQRVSTPPSLHWGCAWLSLTQWWAVLALTIGFVFVGEMLNTLVETLVDLVTPGYHPLANMVKDVAAGAVLLTAIISVIVGLFVLGPPLCARVFGG